MKPNQKFPGTPQMFFHLNLQLIQELHTAVLSASSPSESIREIPKYVHTIHTMHIIILYKASNHQWSGG